MVCCNPCKKWLKNLYQLCLHALFGDLVYLSITSNDLVIAINKSSSKDKIVMHLLHSSSFLLHILISTSLPLTYQCNGWSSFLWQHVLSLRSHSYPYTLSCNYTPSAFRLIISLHVWLYILCFSSIIPTNFIMHLLIHSSLLYIYVSQKIMFPHSVTQYDHISTCWCTIWSCEYFCTIVTIFTTQSYLMFSHGP